MAQAVVQFIDEYEFEAYRCAKKGETILSESGYAIKSTHDHLIPSIVLREPWVWPAWLKAPWIVQSSTGHWFAFTTEPHLGRDGFWNGGDSNYQSFMNPDVYDFTPPPCTDWRSSKRKNPNL